MRKEDILEDVQAPLAVSTVETEPVVVPKVDVNMPPSASPAQMRAARGFVPQYGSYVPKTFQELAEVESGRSFGFTGAMGAGLADSLIGYAFKTGNAFEEDPGERIKYDIESNAYREENPFKNFVGELIGRGLGDSPIDLAVGFGLGSLAKVARGLSIGKNVSRGAIDSFDIVATKLNKWYNTPGASLALRDRLEMNAVEGLIAGAISESAAQHLGKEGGLPEIVSAALGDMVASPVIGEVFRLGWKGATIFSPKAKKEMAKAISETTDIPVKEVEAELETQINQSDFMTMDKYRELQDIQARQGELAQRYQDQAKEIELQQKDFDLKLERDIEDLFAEEISFKIDAAQARLDELESTPKLLSSPDVEMSRETGIPLEDVSYLSQAVDEIQAEIDAEVRVRPFAKAMKENIESAGKVKLLDTPNKDAWFANESGLPIEDVIAFRKEAEAKAAEAKAIEGIQQQRLEGGPKLLDTPEALLSRQTGMPIEDIISFRKDAEAKAEELKAIDVVQQQRLEGGPKLLDTPEALLSRQTGMPIEDVYLVKRIAEAKTAKMRKDSQKKLESRDMKEAKFFGLSVEEYTLFRELAGLTQAKAKKDLNQKYKKELEDSMNALLLETAEIKYAREFGLPIETVRLIMTDAEAIKLRKHDGLLSSPSESKVNVFEERLAKEKLSDFAVKLDLEKDAFLRQSVAELRKIAADADLPIAEVAKWKNYTNKIRLEKLKELSEAEARASQVDYLTDPNAIIKKQKANVAEGKTPKADGKKVDDIKVTSRNITRLIKDSLPSTMKDPEKTAVAQFYKNVIAARAKAVDVEVDEWLKGISISRKADTPSVLFKDTRTILNLPAKATSVADLFHELGHIIEMDLELKDGKGALDAVIEEYKMLDASLPRGSKNRIGPYGSKSWSEKFANDFVTWVRDGELPQAYPKSLKDKIIKLFKDIKDWLKNIFADHPAEEMDDEVKDMFSMIFSEGQSRAVSGVRRGRRGPGNERFLPASPDPLIKGEDLDVELIDVQPLQRGLTEKIVREIKDFSDEIAGAIKNKTASIANKNNKVNSLWNKAIKNLPKFITTGAMTPQSLFNSLGDAGRKIWNKLNDAIHKEHKYQSRNWAIIDKAVKKHNFTQEDVTSLSNKHTLTLEVLGADGKPTTIKKELSGLELLNLHMYARNKPKAEGDKFTAAQSLESHGYKFDGDEDATVLTPIAVKDLSRESGLPEEVLKASVVIRESLDELGDIQRRVLEKKGISTKDFDIGQDYYMKLAEGNEGRDPLFVKGYLKDKDGKYILDGEGKRIKADTLNNKLFAKQNAELIQSNLFNTTSANHKRSGDGVLLYQNPLEALMKHSNQQARLEAMGNELAFAQAVINHNKVRLSKLGVFDDLAKALSSVAGIRMGDPIAGKIQGKIFKNQVLASLAFNPSPIAKQIPSLISGLQALGVSLKDSGKYMADAMEKGLHDDLIKIFPTYETRYKSSGQSAELHDVGVSDSFNNVFFGGASISDAAKRGGIFKGIEAFAQKGMKGIQEADGMVIRSLYLAAKDKLGIKESFADMTADQIDRLDAMVNKTINETQPSYHPLTRSTAQSSENLLTRQFAMFSSQPMKNFNLILRGFQDLSEMKPGTPEYKAAKERLVTSAKIVALQSALVAGAGTAALSGKDLALDMMRSDEDIASREKFYGEMGREASRFWNQTFSSVFGNLPVSGHFLGNMLSRAVTGQGFELSAIPLDIYNDINEMFADMPNVESSDEMIDVLSKGLYNLTPYIGVPRTALQATKAAASGLSEE